MIQISGQKKVPTFQYEDFIVADFSVDEFLTELNKFPQICQIIEAQTFRKLSVVHPLYRHLDALKTTPDLRAAG